MQSGYSKKTKIDVTGGLKEKIKLSQKSGIKAQIINGFVPDNLKKSIHDESIGTLVLKLPSV